MRTEHFAIVTFDPDRRGGQVQIPDPALGPAVHPSGSLPTAVTDRLKALVGLYPYLGLASVFQNDLVDNFDSTKGEIGCYSGLGHRRPPSDRVYLAS